MDVPDGEDHRDGLDEYDEQTEQEGYEDPRPPEYPQKGEHGQEQPHLDEGLDADGQARAEDGRICWEVDLLQQRSRTEKPRDAAVDGAEEVTPQGQAGEQPNGDELDSCIPAVASGDLHLEQAAEDERVDPQGCERHDERPHPPQEGSVELGFEIPLTERVDQRPLLRQGQGRPHVCSVFHTLTRSRKRRSATLASPSVVGSLAERSPRGAIRTVAFAARTALDSRRRTRRTGRRPSKDGQKVG